jgi:hypothetical protein
MMATMMTSLGHAVLSGALGGCAGEPAAADIGACPSVLNGPVVHDRETIDSNAV